MKKTLAVFAIIIAAAILGLAGCSQGETESPPAPVPLSIAKLTASIGGDRTITLKWKETGNTGQVSIAWTPGGETAQVVEAGRGSFRVTGLDYAADYDFTATSRDGDGAITATCQASWTTAPSGAVFVATPTGLDAVRDVLGGYYVLTADINLAGRSFAPIGDADSPFGGTFDGNGHAIRNLTLAGTGDYRGLFGVNGGILRRLGVVNADVHGANSVGALVGENRYEVTECWSTGAVSATGQYAGGLIGNTQNGSISRSWSSCAVAGGTAYAGGLIGYSAFAGQSDCYASGDVSGGSFVGGLFGREYGGYMERSYATGIVSGSASVGGLLGGAYNTYYDYSYFNSLSPNNGIGNSTSLADMRIQATYDSHWDFVGTWGMDPGVNGGYPYLRGNAFGL